MSETAKESWGASGPYEQYVGRWSRKIATEFLRWLGLPHGAAWADVGCGTGTLAECILATYEPLSITGVDKSDGFIFEAERNVADPRARFEVGDATDLPWDAASFDVTVSGLVLNFVPNHEAMAEELARVTKPGGTVATYVWDYAGGMEMMRHFWDAAIKVSPHDSHLDQAERFPVCQPGPLERLFKHSGLCSVSVRAIEVQTIFRDFEDYWTPFLGKQGAAPTYLASLEDAARDRIREVLRSRLAAGENGRIELTARAWAVKGVV